MPLMVPPKDAVNPRYGTRNVEGMPVLVASSDVKSLRGEGWDFALDDTPQPDDPGFELTEGELPATATADRGDRIEAPEPLDDLDDDENEVSP